MAKYKRNPEHHELWIGEGVGSVGDQILEGNEFVKYAEKKLLVEVPEPENQKPLELNEDPELPPMMEPAPARTNPPPLYMPSEPTGPRLDEVATEESDSEFAEYEAKKKGKRQKKITEES